MTADGPGHSGHRAAPSLPAARLDALTDGIFAVAMTLLVLGLDRHIPDPLAGQTLFGGLLEFGDQFADYVISFAVLGVFWLGHLRMTRRLREADTTFVLGNLAFLFFVTMIPPLTTLIGDHPNRPRAAILYGANLLFLLLCEAAMWHRICHRLANESLANPLGTWRLGAQTLRGRARRGDRRHRCGDDRNQDRRDRVALALDLRAPDRPRRRPPAGQGRAPRVRWCRPRSIFCGPFDTSFIIFCACSYWARS